MKKGFKTRKLAREFAKDKGGKVVDTNQLGKQPLMGVDNNGKPVFKRWVVQ